MSGFTGVMCASGPSFTYTNIAGNADTTYVGAGAVSVRLNVNTAGTWSFSASGGGTSFSPSGTQTWVTPNDAGSGNTRWLRMTVSSGDTPTGITAGAWTALSTNLVISLGIGPATTAVSNLVIEIATDAAGSNIVSSGAVQLSGSND